jgi:hypothetical protein
MSEAGLALIPAQQLRNAQEPAGRAIKSVPAALKERATEVLSFPCRPFFPADGNVLRCGFANPIHER